MKSVRNRRRLVRDEEGASAIMEDLPAFMIVTIAVGIFLITGLNALGAYKEGFEATEAYEDAYRTAMRLRADDAFLVPFASHPGEFGYSEILDLGTISDDEDAVRLELGVDPHVRVRVLDVNPTTCAPRGCELFRFDNDVPETASGSIRIFPVPVTITYGASEVRPGILEVATWTP